MADSKRGEECPTCHTVHRFCLAHRSKARNAAGGLVPCNMRQMQGQDVCPKHGGKAPQSLGAARERIERLVHPAITEFEKMLADPTLLPAVKVSIVKDVLDRAGYGANQKVEVDVHTFTLELPKPLES